MSQKQKKKGGPDKDTETTQVSKDSEVEDLLKKAKKVVEDTKPEQKPKRKYREPITSCCINPYR